MLARCSPSPMSFRGQLTVLIQLSQEKSIDESLNQDQIIPDPKTMFPVNWNPARGCKLKVDNITWVECTVYRILC